MQIHSLAAQHTSDLDQPGDEIHGPAPARPSTSAPRAGPPAILEEVPNVSATRSSTGPTPAACRRPLALLVLGAPAEEAHLDLPDAQCHYDADGAQHEERHHHVGGIERAERLDDEITQPPA